MGKNRPEAFSDGVIAIIITIRCWDSKSRTARISRHCCRYGLSS
jgi:hypothetical protein